jgi:RNA polymerase sigma-70 factor (sigma-E family)
VVTDATVLAVDVFPATESFDDALVELYRTHAKALVEMLWVFVGDRAEAEDLAHEAFLRLHRAWGRLDHSRNMGGYLRATAFNLARSGFRRRLVALRHRDDTDQDAAPASDAVMLSEDQAEVVTAKRRLPARQRQCVVLRYWDDQSDGDIAAALGLSVNSVKTHLRRAMANLEKNLEVRS